MTKKSVDVSQLMTYTQMCRELDVSFPRLTRNLKAMNITPMMVGKLRVLKRSDLARIRKALDRPLLPRGRPTKKDGTVAAMPSKR